MNNKLAIAKLVVNIVVGAGTTSITNSIIRNNVAPANLVQSISIGAASVVIGSMASSAAKEHTSARIDEIVNAWTSVSKPSEEIPAEA